MMTEINISDVTLKQAHTRGALKLSFKEKLEIAKLLDRLGASVIEIEGIENKKIDTLRIKSIARAVKNTTLAVPVKLDASDADQVWSCLAEAHEARLQVCASLSPAQMEYIHGIKAPAMPETVAGAIAACKKLTDNVEFVAEDATRSDVDFLCEVIKCAIVAGAKTVTLCDAAGAMMPEEFGGFLLDVKRVVPELKDVTLGVAYSNELFMANASGVAAIKAGASEIKSTMYPLNTISTLEIATVLSAKSDVITRVCDIEDEADSAGANDDAGAGDSAGKTDACGSGEKANLSDAGESASQPGTITCSVRTTEIKRISSQIERICTGGSAKFSNITPTSTVTEANAEIELTAHDSLEAVTECATRLGYELSPEDSMSVYEAFQRIAKKKDVVDSRELDTIVAASALQVPETYKLENYVFTSGNTLHAMARVTLYAPDGTAGANGLGADSSGTHDQGVGANVGKSGLSSDSSGSGADNASGVTSASSANSNSLSTDFRSSATKEGIASGDGPIDASFMAIENIVGRHFELDDFQIRAVTEGREAVGETVVKLLADGKLYSGRGVSTDIVGSAIRAYVNAVNKIVYEEQN